MAADSYKQKRRQQLELDLAQNYRKYLESNKLVIDMNKVTLQHSSATEVTISLEMARLCATQKPVHGMENCQDA